MQVYIVDDDDGITDSVRFLLSTLKIDCRTFGSGPDFLAKLGTLTPGCVILDVAMAEMSGPDIHEEMIARDINWPVIFLTGNCSVSLIVSAVKRGAVEFVLKPSTEKALLTAIQKAAAHLVSPLATKGI